MMNFSHFVARGITIEYGMSTKSERILSRAVFTLLITGKRINKTTRRAIAEITKRAIMD